MNRSTQTIFKVQVLNIRLRRVIRACRFVVVCVTFSAVSVAAEVVDEPGARIKNWGRGPISVADPFPFGVLAPPLVVDSPAVIAPGAIEIGSQFSWSNTINRRGDSFLIDAETRIVTAKMSYGLAPKFQVGARLPIIWRGGGSLDSLIFDWHEFFSMPQGPRDDAGIENDEYQISGKNEDGSRFSFDGQGYGLGNAGVHGKYLLSAGDSEAPAVALSTELVLPTARTEYGLTGLGLTLNLLASKRFGWIILYGGASSAIISDQSVSGVSFDRNRYATFGAVEFEWSRVSLHLAGHLSSSLVDEVSRFPNYQFYLDTGVSFSLSQKCILEIAVRENPAPSTGTTDFTAIAGFRLQLP